MKKQKYCLTIGAIACSALLGLVGLAKSTYASDPLDPDVHHDAAMQVVNDYEQLLQSYFSTNYPDLSVSFNKDATAWRPYYMPDYINHAYVRLMWAYSLETHYDDAPIENMPEDPNAEMMVNFLVGKGFQEYINRAETYPINTEYLNSSTGVICSFINNTSLNGISCSHVDELQIGEGWQNFINAIGAAYYAKENKAPFVSYDNEAYVSDPDIKDSDYSPYQYVSVPMGNFHGLFYRQSPTSEWVYFEGTQAPLSCDRYTGEAQKGFAGSVCYNGTEESKVTVATESNEEEEKEDSDLLVPDTGEFTMDKAGLIVGISATTIAGLSFVAYLSRYFLKRQKVKVHFNKK